MKRVQNVHVKLTDEERAAIEAAARAENVTLSEYLRRRAVTRGAVAPRGDAAVAPTAATPRLEVHHVDELGPDNLRADNGALSR